MVDEDDGVEISRASLSSVLEEVPFDHEVWAVFPYDLLNTLLMFGEQGAGHLARTTAVETPYGSVAAALAMAEVEWAKTRGDHAAIPKLVAQLDEAQPGNFFSKLAHGWYDPSRVLAKGHPMPDFDFERMDSKGDRVTRTSLEGHPALIYI